jgi:hypothetical protein
MFKILLASLSVLIISCNSNNNQNSKIDTEIKPTKNGDSGFSVTKTNKLMTAPATAKYTHKNRNKTQFALDKNSRQEKDEIFLIKISDNKVIISDENNKIIHEFLIEKTWIDKAGPSTVYNLIDDNNVECSLDHYIDINKHNYFAFRYKKILETYSNE